MIFRNANPGIPRSRPIESRPARTTRGCAPGTHAASALPRTKSSSPFDRRGLRHHRFLVPLLLGITVMAVHPNGQMGCADSRWSIPTSVSLLDQGNFDLDEYLPVIEARG